MPIQSGYPDHSAPQNPAKFHTPFADPISITALRADAFFFRRQEHNSLVRNVGGMAAIS